MTARSAGTSKGKVKGKSVAESGEARRMRAARVYRTLLKTYPDARCALNHDNAFQLLVATILSAQCTDARVNMVTPALFARFPTPDAMAKAAPAELEDLVRTTGFFRNKAKAIKAAAQTIVEQFGGQVPGTMDELLTLAGVARKTANVVLGNAFDTNVGVVVDTHVGRLSSRLGLSSHADPGKIEHDLMGLFPQRQWTMLAHLLIFHGRRVCTARKAMCSACRVADDCPKIGVSPT